MTTQSDTQKELKNILDGMICKYAEGELHIEVLNDGVKDVLDLCRERLANKIMREKLAKLCHEQWSGWMKYLFSKCIVESDKLIIPKWAVKGWGNQLKTQYKDLTEKEKNSDRDEADRIEQIIQEVFQ